MKRKIALGGGCHWCTEAVFQQVKGVSNVEQGWIASEEPNDNFSEAIIVHYDNEVVNLIDIVEIHIETHSAASDHRMRYKYRSAIYYFDQSDQITAEKILKKLGQKKGKQLITKVLPFCSFKKNKESYLNYYKSNPDRPFCVRYIKPKLEKLSAIGSSRKE